VSPSLLAEFCGRLACGLACMMAFTSTRAVGVQFFRTMMFTVLGLDVLAILVGPGLGHATGILLLICSVTAFGGSVAWTLGRVGAGWSLAVLLMLLSCAALVWPRDAVDRAGGVSIAVAAVSLVSALLLGSIVAAMLLGHSYLIAPAMSIEPLQRLVVWFGASIAARAVLAGVVLAVFWGGELADSRRAGGGFWWTMLAARWLIGFVAPAVLAWMTWQTTRIPATQSATGILYAAVILIFFGELVGQLLATNAGLAL